MHQSEPLFITKGTFKIMKYLYFHKSISVEKLEKSCGEMSLTHAFYLCRHEFAAYRKPTGEYTYDASNISFDGSFMLTLAGEQYVENKLSSFYRWLIPTIISLTALILSVVSLISTIGPIEVFVHLLE